MSEDYYLSETWKKKRKAALRRASYKCQYCGAKEVPLQCHHLTYERFGGKEKPGDLRIACENCHPIADQVRRFEKGMKTYMSKKYGEKWQDFFNDFEAAEEFKRWLNYH